MEEISLTVNIDQLKKKSTEEIKVSANADILDIHVDDFYFHGTLDIQGEAYLASNNLILHLDLSAYAFVNCSICTKETEFPVQLHNFYHVEPLENLKRSIFDYSQLIKEELLLEVPRFKECNGGKCPEREALSQYLKQTQV